MIPKLNGPFNVRDARASVTWVYKDGSPTEHVQSAAAAFLFAACDRIEALERENADLAKVVEAARLCVTPCEHGGAECSCMSNRETNVVERAQKAEARVKELEREDAGAYEDLWRRTCSNVLQLEARVAVLREALEDEVERRDHDVSGRGQHLTSCRLCEFEKILATLDPAATALTERLKAAEAAIVQLTSHNSSLSNDDLAALAAWRKVKGEPGA